VLGGAAGADLRLAALLRFLRVSQRVRPVDLLLPIAPIICLRRLGDNAPLIRLCVPVMLLVLRFYEPRHIPHTVVIDDRLILSRRVGELYEQVSGFHWFVLSL
jgi:hypothetical protein